MDEKIAELKTKFKEKTIEVIADIATQELGISHKGIKEDTEIPDDSAGFMVLMRMSGATPGGSVSSLIVSKTGQKYLCTVGELADLCVDQAFKNHEIESE